MNPITADTVRQFLVERNAEALASKGMDGSGLPDEFDFLTEGIIDSFGILEMISAMEERFGFQLDYESIDPQDLTRIGPLARFVATQTGADPGGGE